MRHLPIGAFRYKMRAMKYTNVAFYYFFSPPGPLEKTRVTVKEYCLERDFRGTVILAPEGINLMVAGEAEKISEFEDYLRAMIGKDDLFFKHSYSDYQPFTRMIVRAKQQCIPVDFPGVKPDMFDATHLPPEELNKWYEENKDFVILDTRNEFEFNIGTFENAKQLNIENFRDFEKNIDKCPEDWKDKPLVTFCTGGIRCEKAVPILKEHGFKQIYQLDGGILNYFEKVGGAHYQGDCFVFDKRVALNSQLEETDIAECFVCRHPVTPEEQKLPTYEPSVSCPYCYDSRDPQ